jgi:hypothetical protein
VILETGCAEQGTEGPRFPKRKKNETMGPLKKISADAVGKALALAERYRLLNEPEQAASICRDVLAAQPGHKEAAKMLLLALTDGFGTKAGPTLQEAEAAAAELEGDYERAYYEGIVYERWGRHLLAGGTPAYVAGEWLQKAMAMYERAEGVRPEGDDAALLRWNACQRLIERIPDLLEASQAHELHLGD